MNVRYSKYINAIHLGVDLLILTIAFFISYYFVAETAFGFNQYLDALLLGAATYALITLLINKDQAPRTTEIWELVRFQAWLVLVTFGVMIVGLFIAYELDHSRLVLTTAFFLFTIGILFWKVSFQLMIRKYRERGFNFRNVVFVGRGELSQKITRFFEFHPELGFRVLGFFDAYTKNMPQLLGKPREVEEYIKDNPVDVIYLFTPYIQSSTINSVTALAKRENIQLKLVSDFRGFPVEDIELEQYDSIPILNINYIPLNDRLNKFGKRVFDVVFSLAVTVFIMSWLTPLLGILIKLETPGPIFFLQKRTGKNNEAFWCIKFRSMSVNAESDHRQATKNDQRITRVGQFIRRTSIDELPQFFNVLTGDMSVVGPRPHMVRHTNQYGRQLNQFLVRHYVKPGITGLAQIKGYRGETKNLNAMRNRVRYDNLYIKNWNILLDVMIIIETCWVLLRDRKTAY